MRLRIAIALSTACVATAACSSSGSGGPTGPAAGPTSPATGPASHPASTGPAASSGSPAHSPSAGSIAIGGDFTGTATAALCTGAIASIRVKLDGDSQIYLGSISAKSFGFVGPDAADYTLKAGGPLPVVSADATSFTVTDATLVDLVSGKSVTASGTVTCP